MITYNYGFIVQFLGSLKCLKCLKYIKVPKVKVSLRSINLYKISAPKAHSLTLGILGTLAHL